MPPFSLPIFLRLPRTTITKKSSKHKKEQRYTIKNLPFITTIFPLSFKTSKLSSFFETMCTKQQTLLPSNVII